MSPSTRRALLLAFGALLGLLLLALVGSSWWTTTEVAPIARPEPVPEIAATEAPPTAAPRTRPKQKPLLGSFEQGAEPRDEQPDTGIPVLTMVLPVDPAVGDACEAAVQASERVNTLLFDLQTAKGQRRRAMLRELGPQNVQATSAEDCPEAKDHGTDVTRALCDELDANPQDEELMLIVGFAGITCP